MAVNQTIGAISTAPQLGVDTKEVFVEKAETVWGELKLRVPELNTAFSQVNTTEASINAKEASAVASASAAANSELVATASANFKGSWSSATAYTVGQSVLGADNAFYVCLVAHTNQNPTSTSGYWKVNVPIGAIGNINSPLLDMPLKNSLAMKAGVGSATFTRASTATYIDRYGVLKTAAIDEPRFEKEGYKNEGSSTNLLTYSEDFSNAIWVANGTCVKSSTTEIAPDGTSTACLVTGCSLYANRLKQTVGIVAASSSNIVSIYLKGIIGGETVVIRQTGVDTTVNTICTLTTEWKKFVTTVRISDGITSVNLEIYGSTSPSFYIAKPQFEQLPFATSYIPTGASTVTRAADNLTLSAGGNYKLPSDAKTILIDYDILGYGIANQTLFDLTGASQYNRILSFAPTIAAPADRPICYYSGAAMVFGTSAVPTNTKNRLAYVLPSGTATQSVTRYFNGVFFEASSQTITSNTAPATIFVGRDNSATSVNHFGHISNIRVYDKALTATEIALA